MDKADFLFDVVRSKALDTRTREITPGDQLGTRTQESWRKPAMASLPMNAEHYLLRLTRHGPLVAARRQWLDHEPGVPDNKLDRGNLSRFPQVDIAGEVVEPELLEERLWAPRGHWKWVEPITRAEYEYRLQHLRWAERNDPESHELRPRRPIDLRTARIPKFAERV